MQISYNEIINNKNILSPNNYLKVAISSNTKLYLRDLIDSIDKGTEVGSNNYVEKSQYKFIRTAAITLEKYSILEDDNSVLFVSPRGYVNYNLKENDILICKDSNVGEVVKLNYDLPNYMISSGINRLNISNNKDYLFGIMKNHKFKEQLISMIPKGATIMHAKDLFLNCLIPFPNSDEVINYISSLVRIVLHKEKTLESKMKYINNLIENEINNNQKKNNYQYNYPSISSIIKINRLDTGSYTKEFCDIDNILKNYKNGYFYISKDNIKGGQTPKKRVIDNDKSLKYNWITPSYINDDGTLLLNYKINCDKNNVNRNCSFIINRTSKGGSGEYVGISSFYDYDKLGPAQHNQGIYQIFNKSDEDLIYLTCMLNSKIYRKYCANMSMGSKMKELKLNNILSIPFPIFPYDKKMQIVNSYYNKISKEVVVDISDFELKNEKWDNEAGVMDLYESIQNTKEYLNECIDRIYDNGHIKIIYKIF